MKKWMVFLVFGVLLVFIGISYFNFDIFERGDDVKQVCFSDNCFSCEVSDTDEERAKGLMFREFLDKDECMLFVFDSMDVHSFWMKNTLIDLDIVWLDEDKQVVYIAQGIAGNESSINPNIDSLYVLEFNSDVVDELGVSVGAVFEWD